MAGELCSSHFLFCYNRFMKFNIRLAKESDLPAYTKLLQKTYQDTYMDESIGLTKECFSEEIFNTEDTQKYLRSKLIINETQKTWFVFVGRDLSGSISIET